MIVTGIFLFLLGTKLGNSELTPVRAAVTSNDRISPENIPQSRPVLVQKGSVLDEEKPVPLDPLIEYEPVNIEESDKPEVQGEEKVNQIPADPDSTLVFPEFSIQVNAKPFIREILIPGLPEAEIAAPVFVQETDFTLDKISSPSKLPSLVIIEKPTRVEDKTVILIPAPALPIEAMVPRKVLRLNSALPTIYARNIILNRVLPRIIYEKPQKVELISFPSARITPPAKFNKIFF